MAATASLTGVRSADEYLGSGEAIHWRMIRAAYTSVAHTAIVPLQGVLGLPSNARMNVPGKAEENWRWRMRWEQVGRTADTLRRMTALAGAPVAQALQPPPPFSRPLPNAQV
jgi:4-alpha-glucanotransferase